MVALNGSPSLKSSRPIKHSYEEIRQTIADKWGCAKEYKNLAQPLSQAHVRVGRV